MAKREINVNMEDYGKVKRGRERERERKKPRYQRENR